MELLLYKLKTATDNSTVKLITGEDTFVIDGFDSGSGVKEVFGGYGYEYSLTVKKKFAYRLKSGKQKDWSDQDLLDFFQKFVDDGQCFSKIRSLLETREIPFKSWTWRDSD